MNVCACFFLENIDWGGLWGAIKARLIVSMCGDLSKTVSDSADFPFSDRVMREIQPMLIFQELSSEPNFHWGHYVAFVDWVKNTHGSQRARKIVELLQKENVPSLPSIWPILSGWLRLKCGPERTPSE